MGDPFLVCLMATEDTLKDKNSVVNIKRSIV